MRERRRQKRGNTWYSVAYGPVTIVHYSTERSMATDSPQYLWLAQTLRSIDRTVTPWVIAMGHRPTYVDWKAGASEEYDTMAYYQYLLDPLFTETKVDLVFHGHKHVTQRHCACYMGKCMQNSTFDPVTNMNVYRAPQNPVYLVMGNSGATSGAKSQGSVTGSGRRFALLVSVTAP